MRLRGTTIAIALLGCLAATVQAETEEEFFARLEAYRGVTVTDITLEGNQVTRDFVIGREIWTEVGESLDPEKVRDDVIRLENLAIFGSVIVEETATDGGVALNFHFTEMPSLIPYPSLKYTEENGFSVGAGIASPNFLGRNVTLSANAVFGGTTAFNFSGRHPWITGNHVSAEVRAFHQERKNKLLDFEEASDMASFVGGMHLGRHGRLRAGGGFYGVGSDTDGITLRPENYDRLWHAGFAVGYDRRDSWRVPHEGWELELAPMYFGGDANSWTVNFDARRYQPVAQRHTIATGGFLALQSGEVGTHIPSYLQYFLGGANSVRGYKVEELGKELFGQNQLLYTLEYRYILLPLRPYRIFKWSIGVGFEVAGFSDVGVAWSEGRDFNLDRTRIGFGAGLRVLLPAVDSVRFDVGVSQFGNVVFNFGINNIFVARQKRIR